IVKSLKPFVLNTIVNTINYCNETTNKCSLSHSWISFSKTANDIFEQYKYIPSIIPLVCKACLAIKFGLTQTFKNTMVNFCSIDKYHQFDIEEGPYLKAISKPVNKNKIVFQKNT